MMIPKVQLSPLATDTLKGLSANKKYLLSKYFYDDMGSRIFQDIMHMPEYYLTDCEFEIFKNQKQEIIAAMAKDTVHFELVELGSGDGLKTKILLNALVSSGFNFKYIPVDISKNANDELETSLAALLPSLEVKPETGDFFKVMNHLNGYSGLHKIIFFLGSNIGNFSDTELDFFFNHLAKYARKGDKVMIGFDLKKSPNIIMNAYNDPHGHTRNFNFNHLARLNRELDANFDLHNFEQYSSYNPHTGIVKSHLISLKNQVVQIETLEREFYFKQWETIFMEISRKFDLETIESLAIKYGFEVENHFVDSQKYFTDSLWVKVK